MPALVTNKFKIHNAKQFREMFDEASLYGGSTASTALSTNLYLFIGKSSSWSGDYSDVVIPNPNTTGAPSSDTTANTVYSHWKDMIAAKKIASSDVSHVVSRENWTSGRHYAMYDDTELFSNLISSRALQNVKTSGGEDTTATLYPMYVMNSTYQVYKCLYNGKGTDGRPFPSTVEPTSTDTNASPPAALSDGYVWKYLFTISTSDQSKFLSSSYIPVKQIRDANTFGEGGTTGGMAVSGDKDDGSDQVTIERNAIAGALDVFYVSNVGSGYHFEENKGVYSGSGTSLTISAPEIKLVENGKYNNSSVYFVYGGNGYVRKVINSVYDAINDRVVLTLNESLGVTVSGTPTANIAPYVRVEGDGEGIELVLSEGSTANTISKTVTVLNSGNSYTYATATVEQQGTLIGSGGALRAILPPKGGHGYDPIDELGGHFVMIDTSLALDEGGTFTVNNDFRKIGILKDPNEDGTYTRFTGDSGDQTKRVVYSANSVDLSENTTITGQNSGATGYMVDFNTQTTTIRLIDVTNGSNATAGYDGKSGSFQVGEICDISTGGTLTISSSGTPISNGAMAIGSGEILYIENRTPVSRASNQTENVKLIIEF